MVTSTAKSDYLTVIAGFIFLICGFEPNEVYSKETHGISYIKNKHMELIPIMVFIGKIVSGLLFLKGD